MLAKIVMALRLGKHTMQNGCFVHSRKRTENRKERLMRMRKGLLTTDNAKNRRFKNALDES